MAFSSTSTSSPENPFVGSALSDRGDHQTAADRRMMETTESADGPRGIRIALMVGLLPFLVLFVSRDDIERRVVGADGVRRTLLLVCKRSRVDTGPRMVVTDVRRL
jgi:hypothetical protein